MNSTVALILLPFVIAIPSIILALLIREVIKLRKERLGASFHGKGKSNG